MLALIAATGTTGCSSDVTSDASAPALAADPYGARVSVSPVEEPPARHLGVLLTPHSTGVAATPAPPVMAASFEPASAACNDWVAEDAEAIRSVPPHAGSYACRICAGSGASTDAAHDIALTRAVGPLPAGRYVLTAWLRNRPGRASPAGAVGSLEADTALGLAAASSPVVVGDTYALVRVALELTRDATELRARISASATATECVLIDDVLVERVD